MSPKPVSFQTVLDALLDRENPFPPVYLNRFSDLEPKDLAELAKIWEFVPLARRRAVIEDLEELADADTLVCFDELARYALDDSDPQIRALAIRLLWESNDKKLVPVFIRMMETDPDQEVRSTAAAMLGNFVYQGEVEELPANVLADVEESLLKVTRGNDQSQVRRRALESLGFSSRPEVPDLLQKAYRLGQPDWMESALFAMGRSADTDWEEYVLSQLTNPTQYIQEAAIRAAGELTLESARAELLEILQDTQDDDIWATTAWSLSQIGGEGVRETLEKLLDESEDDDEISFLEEALDNLSFSEDMANFGFLDIDASDVETHLIELDTDDPDDQPKRKKHGPASGSIN